MVAKLEKVVEGMSIKGKPDKSNQNCEICTQGEFTESRNKQADAKAPTVLELVHTDLCGPIELADEDGYRYAIAFFHTLLKQRVTRQKLQKNS